MPGSAKIFKLILLFLLFLSLVICHLSLVSAQTSLEQAKQDYAYQLGKYRDNHETYTKAKANYQAYQTATAKNEAFLKTKEYLVQVDNLYVAYLALVKESANSVDWTSNPSEGERVKKLLDEENAYISNHQKDIQLTQNLEELPPAAKQLQDRLTQTTSGRIYNILAIYETVNVNSLLAEFLRLSSSIDGLIDQKYPTEKPSVVANWRSEVESVKQEAAAGLEDIQKLLAQTLDDLTSEMQLKNIDSKVKNVNQILGKSKSLFAEILRLL